MVKQIVQFLLQFLLLMLGVAATVYLLSILLPGSHEEILSGMEGTIAESNSPSDSTGLRGFLLWLWDLVQLNFGYSVFSNEPALGLIFSHWKITVLLSALSWIASLLAAIYIVYLLMLSQKKKGIRRLYSVLELTLLSFTPLTLGTIFILGLTALELPIRVFYAESGTAQAFFRYLSAIAVLVLLQIPVYVRSLLQSQKLLKNSAFVQFARSLGYTRKQLWFYDILPNSLLYTIALSSFQLSVLLGGTILVEYSFAIPGLGTLLLQSAHSRDVVLMRGIVLFYGALVGVVHIALKLLRHKFLRIGIEQ